MKTMSICNISGRYTLDELLRLAGTVAWHAGVPETWRQEESDALWDLVRQTREYIEKTPGAVAVDILEGQIVNVSYGRLQGPTHEAIP